MGTYDKNKQDLKSVLNLKIKKVNFYSIKVTDFARRKKAMKLKIDEFIIKGFNNIVLSGHSAGGLDIVKLKSNFPNLIDGVVSVSPWIW